VGGGGILGSDLTVFVGLRFLSKLAPKTRTQLIQFGCCSFKGATFSRLRPPPSGFFWNKLVPNLTESPRFTTSSPIFRGPLSCYPHRLALGGCLLSRVFSAQRTSRVPPLLASLCALMGNLIFILLVGPSGGPYCSSQSPYLTLLAQLRGSARALAYSMRLFSILPRFRRVTQP